MITALSLVTPIPMKSYYSIIDHIPLPSFLIPFFKRQNSPVKTWEILFCLLDLSAKSCYIKKSSDRSQFSSFRRMSLDPIPVVEKCLIYEFCHRDP